MICTPARRPLGRIQSLRPFSLAGHPGSCRHRCWLDELGVEWTKYKSNNLFDVDRCDCNACITQSLRSIRSDPNGQCVRSPQNLPQIRSHTVSERVRSPRSARTVSTVTHGRPYSLYGRPYGLYGCPYGLYGLHGRSYGLYGQLLRSARKV